MSAQVTLPSSDREKLAGGTMATSTVGDENEMKAEPDVSTNGQKYLGDGLRISGDDEDHEHEPPMSLHRFMSLAAMSFLWSGAQIPLYIFGGITPYIYGEIGGADRWVWLVLANMLGLASICPFVGALSDLLGRRYVAMIGSALIIIGMIVCSTVHNMNSFIAGMALAGVGAGISEFTALAGTGELAPTAKRGKYIAILLITIAPFLPSFLYAQLIAAHSNWRFAGLLCALWVFVGLIITAVFYFPPPRVNSRGLTAKEIIKQIDWVGGLLYISGLILFLAGLLWGGYMYSWHSAHTLVPLILGIFLLSAFGLWEAFGTQYPMLPRRLGKDPRLLTLILIITFISGANFFSVLLFWPTQAFNEYGHDPLQVGLRGLPLPFSITTGGVVVLWLLSVFRGGNRLLLIVSSVLMTAGCGALAAARLDNLSAVYGILVVAGLGIGGVTVPSTIMTAIICPDDLIATSTALTLALRVIGGAVGYTTYYNVFFNKLVPRLTERLGLACFEIGISNISIIADAVTLTGASLTDGLLLLPGIDGNLTAFNILIEAGQQGFADAYPWIYYVSIAFGGVSIIASCLLGDIRKYMDNHVAVVIH